MGIAWRADLQSSAAGTTSNNDIRDPSSAAFDERSFDLVVPAGMLGEVDTERGHFHGCGDGDLCGANHAPSYLTSSLMQWAYVTSSDDESVAPGFHRLLDLPVFASRTCDQLPEQRCAVSHRPVAQRQSPAEQLDFSALFSERFLGKTPQGRLAELDLPAGASRVRAQQQQQQQDARAASADREELELQQRTVDEALRRPPYDPITNTWRGSFDPTKTGVPITTGRTAPGNVKGRRLFFFFAIAHIAASALADVFWGGQASKLNMKDNGCMLSS